MEAVGVRELRQRASEIMRKVEDGQTFAITVSGRQVAELSPKPVRHTWRSWHDIADLFQLPPDITLMDQLAELSGELTDPWSSE